jgi:hypothetical protein
MVKRLIAQACIVSFVASCDLERRRGLSCLNLLGRNLAIDSPCSSSNRMALSAVAFKRLSLSGIPQWPIRQSYGASGRAQRVVFVRRVRPKGTSYELTRVRTMLPQANQAPEQEHGLGNYVSPVTLNLF